MNRTDLAGHIFWYANECPDYFGQNLFEQWLSDKNPVNWTVIDQEGVSKIKVGVKGVEKRKAIAAAWTKRFIILKAHGLLPDSLGAANIALTFEPSPLSDQYACFVEGKNFPITATYNEQRMYSGLASRQRYARLRHLSETPNLMRFAFEDMDDVSKVKAFSKVVAERLIAMPTEANFRWLCVLDAEPQGYHIHAPRSLLAEAIPITHLLDKFMFVPSYLTIGAKAVIQAYRNALSDAFPNEKFQYCENGNSAYLLLDDIGSVKRIFLPAWHQVSLIPK